MSCLTLHIRQASESCKVTLGKLVGCVINVFKKTSAKVNCGLTNKVALNVSTSFGMKVNVGIVCTASIGDNKEVWWCEGWKVLWDNGIKTLWVNS